MDETRDTDGWHALCRPCAIVFAVDRSDVFADALYCPCCLSRVAAEDQGDDVRELLARVPQARMYKPALVLTAA